MTWSSGVQCQKRKYRISLAGDARDMPTSQTTSIRISNPVMWTMCNTFVTMQWRFQWCRFNAMSKQLIWFVALRPHGGESISHQEIIQCFSGWRRVWIATLCQLLDAFLRGWCVFLSSRMLCRSFKGILTLVQTFNTGPIHQTAGMLIVHEMHQPLMQHWHHGSDHYKVLFGIGTTDIAPISGIEGGVHDLPLRPQPDRSRWYMSNTIEYNALNFFYMKIIWLDVKNNRFSDI